MQDKNELVFTTVKGAHAGAKSWAEEPSMVICLKPNIDEDTKKQNGVTA